MRSLNIISIVIALFFSSIALSANQDVNFDKERDREISRGKERIQITEDRIKCLQISKDFEDLRKCNDNADKRLDALEAKIKSQAHDGEKGASINKHPADKNKHN